MRRRGQRCGATRRPLGRDAPPAVIERAVHALRADVPEIPAGVDERVIGEIRRARDARMALRRAPRRACGPGLWMVAVASILLLVVLLLGAGPSRQPEHSVASVALTPTCGTISGRTHVRGRQNDDAGQPRRRIVVADRCGGDRAPASRRLHRGDYRSRATESGERIVEGHIVYALGADRATRISLKATNRPPFGGERTTTRHDVVVVGRSAFAKTSSASRRPWQ